MAAVKFSASMDDALLADARAEASAEGLTLSGWLADAAADRLRLKSLRRMVSDWEAEHGVITAEELDAFAERLTAARRTSAQRQSGRQAGGRRHQAAS